MSTSDVQSNQESILRKVRALIAKADNTPFEGEAEVFRAKADQLMAEYHIATWMLAQKDPDKAGKPERRNMDFSWYWDRSTSGDYSDAMWKLFLGCASHCSCVVAHRHASGTIPVYGLKADLDYMDVLFTSLVLQMGSRLRPKYDPALSLGNNIYIARSAGMKYADIAIWLGRPEWEQNGKPVDHGIMAREYKAYMRESGKDEPPVTTIKRYAWSYMLGWVGEVSGRLSSQRKEQVKSDTTGSLLPALRDATQVARETRDEELGGYNRKGRSVQRSERTLDSGAWSRGSTHGRTANISAGRSDLGGSKRELNS